MKSIDAVINDNALKLIADQFMPARETTSLSDALPNGTALYNGNFIIESLIAMSSFGTTYLARDTVLNRDVVIKEYFPTGCRRIDGQVLPQLQQDEVNFTKVRDRFLQEARVLARFHHRGIVSVHSFFEANNTAYMVMEYLQGPTLLQVLEQHGPLPAREIRAIAIEICEALDEVHTAGMLHRDIKPSNIIRCDEGRVVLVDFGLSEKYDDGTSLHTRPLDETLRFGTPGYAPLEQYTNSAQLGPTADIYALGATLYQLSSGEMPAPATDRAIGVELEPPHCGHPILSECILWAMNMRPQKRPVSVRVFMDRIALADDELTARTQLVNALQERGMILTYRAETASQKPKDDTGCMKLAFIMYLGLGFTIALVWLIFLFVRYVLLGHV